MIQFVFKFLCLFYVTVVVNTRTLYSNSDNYGKIGDMLGFRSGNDTIAQIKIGKSGTELKDNEIKKIVENVTEKVLKEQHITNKLLSFPERLDKILYEYSTHAVKTKTTTDATTEDIEFLGTAQIEALLNDIKARAIQMVAEQIPAVTDIISNTVTETTFEADPILSHLEISSPGYALSTFVCLHSVENVDKRTANDSDVILISNKETKHNVSARSVKEDAYTIAQNVEDLLQKELKNIYKKVKNKVSKDYHKEMKQVKSTLKCKSSKVIDKVAKKVTRPMKTSHLTTNKITTASRRTRGNKSSKNIKKTTKSLEVTTPTPTVDDLAMLTLYEQILAKTHEDNVMKMLTTNKKRKIDEIIRLSKRNPETLADLTLKEDIRRIYDDQENIPDLEYNDDVTNPVTSNDYALDSSTNYTTVKSVDTQLTESDTVEDTSYEGLSDKISYKDYVNGYKNYLKFQKDQSKQNFSALVKYQAHRHHNVEDIGKFILNKIPQIPTRKKRYFFDDSDMDDQDISTKSDDSWFKKHFYMFIDNGPPKKYHTSETVEFKDVTEASKVEYAADSIERPGLRVTAGLEVGRTSESQEQTADINLDELSKFLEDYKATACVDLPLDVADSIDTTPEQEHNKAGGGTYSAYKVYAPSIISKFFGKNRRYSVKNNQKFEENALIYDDDDNFLFDNDLDRSRRNAKKVVKNTENLISEKLSTVLSKQDNTKHDKKVGCVSLVTRPTAVVNLHKTNVKGSKIKKLLSKLHYHNRNKKKLKEKRHCKRVERFCKRLNPLQKLKDMFMPRQEEKVLATNSNTGDYDMMTSHIDTFKPVKYDKIPSIDELTNQVPNISVDDTIVHPEKMAIDKPFDKWAIEDDTKAGNKVLTDTNINVVTKNYPVVIPSLRSFQPMPLKQARTESKLETKMSTKQMLKGNFAVTDNVMNVKVKTVPKLEDNMFSILPPVTLESISNEINYLQVKLSTKDDLKDSAQTSQKHKDPEQIKTDSTDNKDLKNDFTIRAKLTRIAKYPKSYLKPKLNNIDLKSSPDNLKFYEFVDDENYRNIHEEPNPNPITEKQSTTFDKYFSNNKNRNKLMTFRSPLEVSWKENDNIEDVLTNSNSDYKTSPDYFHDLVMWNNDILNDDKVLSPKWQDILKSINAQAEYTSPNLKEIELELYDISKHFLFNKINLKDDKNNTELCTITNLSSHALTTPRDYNVAKENNNMRKYSTSEDFDEDPFYVPRNDPKKYTNVKSQDIIKVLNELYTKPNGSQDKANTQRAVGIWDNNKVKNSIKALSHMNKETRPIAKVNKQPKQYYNTPLPMKNTMFEKFLKENLLDVESVTSPMNEMPTITEPWHSGINSLMKTINFNNNMNIRTPKDKTSKVTDDLKKANEVRHKNDIDEIIDRSYPENQINYLNDLEQDLFNDYRENVNVRHKRSSLHEFNTFTDDALIGKENIQSLRNKLNNIFDKKPEASTEMMDLNSVSNPNENELEITIINFDETNQKLGDNQLTVPTERFLVNNKANSTVKDETKISTQNPTKNRVITHKTEKERQLQKSNHQIKKDQSNADLDNVQISSEIQNEINPVNLMHLPKEFREKCKPDEPINIPKRLQISSHSYKYDVLYNIPNKKSTDDKEDSIGDKEGDIELTNLSYVFDKKGLEDNIYGKEYTNSEIPQIIVIVDVVNAVNDFTRPDVPIHISLPTYYAPNTEIGITELLPVNLKPSWTDLVLKYISGIALIEMLSKLGVLKGGFNITDGLNVNFDHDKVFSEDGLMKNYMKSKAKRAAKTTRKRHTFSQTIHFTREMKQQRKKRVFNLLPIIKEKMKQLSIIKNMELKKTTEETLRSTDSLKTIATKTMKLTSKNLEQTTKPNNRTERDSYESNTNNDDIFDYKGDLDESKDEKLNETTMSTLLILNNNIQFHEKNGEIEPVDKEADAMYDGRVYYETATKPNIAVKETRSQIDIRDRIEADTDFNTLNKLKRDVDIETFTAKDVAALEVIVDLLKNTVSYGENKSFKPISFNKLTTSMRAMSKNKTNDKIEHTTNSIQVHIAIPYDAPDKKRSLDQMKVRKVFTAIMATPVDLEYQIHSIEDNTATTVKDFGLSPGMYLIVDDAHTSKGNFAFKPVKDISEQMGKFYETTDKISDETQSNKVTLSKEFVEIINKLLIQLYENIATAHEDANKSNKRKVSRREAHWDKIRNYFGRDRVCNCKCKANETMCRACAASDAVIRELTFEFDNLAKYMTDHCTEIQTFFWMNPSGGRALRDTVHKIDKSLNDYYKRVKGKCMGRTCDTFATYIDKRAFGKNRKVAKNYIEKSLINDLKSLHANLDISSQFIPYDKILKDKGDELVKVVTNCIASKPISKRLSIDNDIKQNNDKEEYTLENLSVNIICNPNASSDFTDFSTISLIENKDKSVFQRKRRPKFKLNELFTYYETHDVTPADTFKREAKYDQVESPLIADTGGSFWHDYLKGKVDVSNDYSKPNVEISVVQTNLQEIPVTQATIKTTTKKSFRDKLKNMYKKKGFTISTTAATAKRELLELSTDSLTYNMKELFKVVGTTKMVEEFKNSYTEPITMTAHRNQTTKHKTKKNKTKKRKKVHKTSKAKMHHKHNTKTTKTITDLPTNAYNSTSLNSTAKLDKFKTTAQTFDPLSIDEMTSLLEKNKAHTNHVIKTTTKRNLFNKIKMATIGFLNKISKGNYVIEKTTKAGTADNSEVKNINDFTVDIEPSNTDTNVMSQSVSTINPTILIISNNGATNHEDTVSDETKESKSKFKSILLSLINFEADKLENERQNLKHEILDENDMRDADLVDNMSQIDADDIENILMNLKMNRKSTTQDLEYDILKDLKLIGPDLEKPAPADIHTQPGLLEKVARKFAFKIVPDRKVDTALISKGSKVDTFRRWRQKSKRSTGFEEADPTKASNLDVLPNPIRIKKHAERKLKPRSGPHKNSDSFKRNLRKYKATVVTGNSQNNEMKPRTNKLHKRMEFDSFVREENGIYRLKKKCTDDANIRPRVRNLKSNKSSVLRKSGSSKKFKKHRSKYKRSSGNEIRNNERVNMWVQNTTGYFMATITSFYIVFALLAAVVNWLFHR